MAGDPVADLILEEAGPLTGRVLVLDDVGGALTRAAAAQGADVLAWCDDLRDALEVPASHRLLGPPPAGFVPDVVLWRLPKSLAALEDYAEFLATLLPPHTRVLAGARTRHMTPTQNTVLARHFTDVSASLGRQKSRVLRASGARPAPRRWPLRRYLPEVGLTAVAHGPVFNTNRLDDGTRMLLRTLSRVLPDPEPNHHPPARGKAIDLGSGSGIIATWLAQRGYAVTAVDVSQLALISTRLTARANHVHVGVRRADGLVGIPPGSATLIATNPPFHRGTAKDSLPTLAMIRSAGAVLRPGGEFWTVYNSHLPYLPELRRFVGVTTIEARDRTYTVTRSMKEDTR